MKIVWLLTILILLAQADCWAADLVEFLSGSELTGTVKQIRKDKQEFDFEAKIGSRTTVRTYTFAKVHAVTMNGKRFVLTLKPDVGSPTESSGSVPAQQGRNRSADPNARLRRSPIG